MTGHLALIGGSEWMDGCTYDQDLVNASGAREVTVLATAAAFENPAKVLARATEWFGRMGVAVHGLPVYTRSDARDGDHAAAVQGASFLYLADGSSQHLRSVLKDTPVWEALVEAWQRGAVLAASGQAAATLCDHMVDARGGAFTVGLGLVSTLTVIPHYDLWSPDKSHRTVRLARPGLVVAGIDERSALIRDPQGRWSIGGAAGAALFRDGHAVGLDALG
jgi:cyanophycinase